MRDQHLYVSYAIVPPQIDRSKPAHKQSDPTLYAGVVKERDEWKDLGKPDARNLACGSTQGGRVGKMTGYAVALGPLVRDLYDWTGRPVVDRTGFTGRFDFTLTWAPEDSTDTDAAQYLQPCKSSSV